MVFKYARISRVERQVLEVPEEPRLLDVIKRRRSVREFEPTARLSDYDLDYLIEAARWAPSARNLQPIEYVIIRSPDRKGMLAEASRQSQPEQASACILAVGDLWRASMVGDVSSHDVTTREKGLNWFIYMDCAAAVQNMLLAANSRDIDSLWISSFDDSRVKEDFGLPERFHPLAIVCLGSRRQEPETPPKRDKEEIVHFEEWKPKEVDDAYLEYSGSINEDSAR
ncbi:MAG: hypothetical protein GF416_07075 [Candidatus Altiarchaeales archaeon]|nr:hypothetical protein [Candidatus Altiarchaeales archaeon]MBD3416875.1 hypothetical protein [Candidatus Altiarchaeales archaeon]